MTRRIGLLLAVPFILVLAACAPAVHPSAGATTSSSPSAASSPSATPSPTPTPTPAPTASAAPINPAAYLIKGVENPHTDTTGTDYGQWAFYTDASKQVWCTFSIFSADVPGAYCFLVGSGKAARTFAVPAGVSNNCDMSSALPVDGYGLGLSLEGFPSGTFAGWGGCSDTFFAPTAYLAKTKVLPDGATLAVSPFSCTVEASVATCHFVNGNSGGGTITLGTGVASFTQN
jgi:hypothetical protein